MREMIRMSCSQCSRNNYYTTKNKRTTTDKLEKKKFCPWCRSQQMHREGKMPNPQKS